MPPPLLPPPDPQAAAAKDSKPLLSVCTHLVPEPPRPVRVSESELRLPELLMLLETKLPIEAVLVRNSVVEARPETKRLVVVAAVPVAFWKVRFWRVVEPLFNKPQLVIKPNIPVLARRLVVEARPETKRFVVVALVPVAFWKVKFWSVVEPLSKRLVSVLAPALKTEAKRFVVEAVIAKKLVVVAFVVVELVLVRLVLVSVVIVDEAPTTALATCAKTADESLCLGETVSQLVPLEDTST